MARVLLGWELGMGLWHVAALREVARELRRRGHEAIFALSNVVGPWALLRDEGFEVLQAPICPPQPMLVDEHATGAETFADILAGTGFGEVAHLLPVVEAWDALLARINPDVVVADHAPALRLAAFGQLPVVGLGLGFTTPPSHLERFPAIKGGEPSPFPEDRVAAVVATVQRHRGRPCPRTLPELFAGTGEFVCSFPEFDPYARFGPRPYAGTLGGWMAPAPRPVAPRFYAYLAADYRAIGTVIEGLVRSGVPGAFVLRGAPAAMRADLTRRGVELFDGLAVLSEVLPTTAVVVHHGGVGISQQAASVGRPQLVFPRHLEQVWNGTALEVLGVGTMMQATPNAMEIAAAMRRLAHGTECADAATGWATEIAQRGHGTPVAAIVDRCEKVLVDAEV